MPRTVKTPANCVGEPVEEKPKTPESSMENGQEGPLHKMWVADPDLSRDGKVSIGPLDGSGTLKMPVTARDAQGFPTGGGYATPKLPAKRK